MQRGFKYHDHTADITIECWGPTLKEAFEEGARATLEVIVDTTTVDPVESVEVSVDGIDTQALLVEWINQLIALIDINSHFYCQFDIEEIWENEEGDMELRATVKGEEIDLEKHDARTEVKAMTYADMKIEATEDRTTLTFTLDL